ncbi:hypothetical protein CL622_00790 [archaeon]|nr:hypothetical protein [archaeon]
MGDFHFTKTYVKEPIFDDYKAKVRVVIEERPSININEEEYSLRITTRYEEPKRVHRKYAIEHHIPPMPHNYPHLQFKFHTEEIGQFRIRIDVKNDKEYEEAILGFIYKIKGILTDLETTSKGITDKILVLPLVNQLEKQGINLTHKIYESIKKYSIEFDEKRKTTNTLERLKKNPLLLEFIGKENMDLIEKEHSKT